MNWPNFALGFALMAAAVSLAVWVESRSWNRRPPGPVVYRMTEPVTIIGNQAVAKCHLIIGDDFVFSCKFPKPNAWRRFWARHLLGWEYADAIAYPGQDLRSVA